MSTYTCLIVEDRAVDAELLQRELSQTMTVHTPYVCNNVVEAREQLIKQRYDLIFLDIQLPGQSGLDWLRSLPHRPPIIITTAFAEYAVDTYDLDIADYLVKPVRLNRLNRAINRVLLNHSTQKPVHEDQTIFLHVNRQFQRFILKEIVYLEAYGSNTKIYTTHSVSTVDESISTLGEQLPIHQFVRIHRSFIVNLSQITRLDYRNIWLDDTKISIGTNYREAVLQLVNWKSRRRQKGEVEP